MAGLMGTDKLHAEESGAYFRVLIEAAPDAMIIVDDDGEMAIVNGQAEKMFGYDREEMLGNTIEMLLPERIRKSHIGHRRTFQEDPELRPMGTGMELIGRRKDGTEFPVEISLSPVSTPKASFVSSVIRDVTERKRAQQALRQSSEKLKFFAYSVMHDLKSPTIGIYGLTELLHKHYKDALDERGKSYCDQILKASVHVAALIEKINVYITTKESPLKIEKIDIKDILQMVCRKRHGFYPCFRRYDKRRH